MVPRYWQPRIQKGNSEKPRSPCVYPQLTWPALTLWEVGSNHQPVRQHYSRVLTAAASRLSTWRRPHSHQGTGIQYLAYSSWLSREPSAEGSVSLSPGWQERRITEAPQQYRKTLRTGKPRYSQVAHCHRSRPITELNWAGSCWHTAPWTHVSSDILLHSQKDTAMADTYWIFIMRIIYCIWD